MNAYHKADRRSDVYSLGVMLFEMLTGDVPFKGEKQMLVVRILTEDPPKLRRINPRVPKDMETVCLKCLEKEPDKRYSTARTLADDLRRFIIGEPITARPISTPERTWRWCRRNPVVASLGCALVMILLSVGIVSPLIAINQSQLAADKTQQLRVSTVMRLAAQSQAIRQELPAQSVLLAIEAVELTRRHDGSVMPVAHETLLTSTASVGGVPLTGHGGRIRVALISPDGHWLVTGSIDKTARLWDLTAEDPTASTRVLRGHQSWVMSVVFSPDSRWLVTGSPDKTARLWDLTAEDPAEASLMLEGHEHSVLSLAISPSGRWLVTGSHDSTARLWDLSKTGQELVTSSLVLEGHEHSVRSLAISPSGRWLVTGSHDSTARLWDLSKTGQYLVTSSLVLRGHKDSIDSLAISPSGRRLVTGSHDNTARLWDLTAENPAASPVVLRGHDDGVTSTAMSPDGRWLVSGSRDKTARLWDLTDRSAAPQELPGYQVHPNAR